MVDRNQFQAVVFRAIDSVNELLLDGNSLAKGDATILIGEAAQLDSMGFVNFVVALEEVAAEDLGLNINLAEEINSRGTTAPKTMTVASLTDFLLALVQSRSAKRD